MATSQPAAGVGVRQPASSRPATARPELVALGVEVGEQVVEQVAVIADSWARAASRVCGPLVEDPAAAAGVVGDGVGQAEAAHQVEGGLDQLAHAGPRLVGAEQLDGEPVGLAADPLLERRDGGEQGSSVRAATHSSRAAVKTGRGEVVAEHLQHRAGAARAVPAAGRPRRRARRRAPR